METRDWNLCFICQKNTPEPLREPASSVQLRSVPEKLEACYINLINNIFELWECDDLPNLFALDNIFRDSHVGKERRILELMKTNRVVWHNKCRSAVNQQKVDRAKRKAEGIVPCQSPIKTRRQSSRTIGTSAEVKDSTDQICFFCKNPDDKNDLRKVSSLSLHDRVNEAARKIGDAELLAKMSGGDMIALNAMYHLKCLTNLYRKADAVDHSSEETYNCKIAKAQAFQELADYIEEHRGSGVILMMTDLKTLYENRLASLGYPDTQSHTTRLKQDILSLFSDITAHQKPPGCWEFVFKKDLYEVLHEMKDNTTPDVRTLVRAARILRRDMLQKKQLFTGSYTSTSEADSVTPLLRSFLHMMLDGTGIRQTVDAPASSEKIVSSLAQTIMFNSVGKRSDKPESGIRHHRERETPQPIMLAMKVHMKSGKANLVDTLAERGICVSYHRLRQLSTDIANAVISYWEQEGVVAPFQATKGVFTTGGVDNIDYNPSSTTSSSKSVLHGSSISILQHFSSNEAEKKQTEILNTAQMGQSTVRTLPVSYTMMDDVSFPKDETAHVPALHSNKTQPVPSSSRSLQQVLQDGYQWLYHVNGHVEDKLARDDWISWAAYHAAKSSPPSFISKSYMLPLFTESSNSPITIFHCMKTIKRAIEYLNPGQTPVMVADQPLFTLAKRLQWKYPAETIAEDKYVAHAWGHAY